MNKHVSIISSSILALAIFTSCSNNVPTSSSSKIDSVAITQVNKSPNQDLSASVNLKLMGTQPKFGIKATIENAWLSQGNISKIHVKLFKVAGSSPEDRFDNQSLATPDPDGTGPALGSEKFYNYPIAPSTGFLSFSTGIFNTSPIKFNNLKPNTTYFVSARAYSSSFNNVAGTISTAGGTTITGNGTAWNSPGRNKLHHGDIITVNGEKATVMNVTNDTTIVVNPALTAAATGSYTVETNVTGSGTLGGSMAADGNQVGGGTASGVATNASDEERISVSNNGTVSISPIDGALGSSPTRTAGANNSLDIAIQIMKEYGGSSDGAIRVFQGGAGDAELVQ